MKSKKPQHLEKKVLTMKKKQRQLKKFSIYEYRETQWLTKKINDINESLAGIYK